jgi:uncharacterized protein
MSKPANGKLFDVSVQTNIMVTMRDGVRLATDIYFPAAGKERVSGPLPVILERTPYDKRGISRSERRAIDDHSHSREEVAHWYAQRGYIVAMQDCRGRYASEGEFVKYLNEPQDGYDTLAWLVEQDWCNGKVGTMGLSYGAHTQSALACLNPPGLACMFMDSGGFANAYHGGIRRGGAFELKQATWAYRHALLSPLTAADPARREALQQVDIVKWFRDMPWSPGHSPLQHAPEFEAYLFEQWQAGRYDDYWRQPGLCAAEYYPQFPDIPVAIVGSWYDPYVHTCISNYMALAAKNSAPTRLLMGPWTHGDRSVSWSGDVDFGEQAILDRYLGTDYWQLRLGWFDECLRGLPATGESAPVRYFRMGGGKGGKNHHGRLQHGGDWQAANSWPPAAAVTEILFLHADGRLEATEATDATLEFDFDPQNPVPTIGGSLTSGEPVMRGGAFDQRCNARTFQYRPGGPQGPLAEREDVLVFETAPLDSDVEVSGAVVGQLFVSSDCPDTDFTLKLVDVYPPCNDYPQGFAMNITDGILRARYRDSWEQEVFMEPDTVYPLTIRPFDTSNLFRRGHRLRVEISSSNYPQFDINPNTGAAEGCAGASRVARNSVHFGGHYPSRIELSVVRHAG